MQPMRMEPVLVERVWGGRRLADVLGKTLPPGRPIGESWELSDHPHARTCVADGPLAGRTLRDVFQQHGPAVLGREEMARGAASRFSLLVKFIDASDRLSVQVHPDDAYAAAHAKGESGKTECWVVVHAEPGAWLIRGLRPGTTRDALAKALRADRAEDLLLRQDVRTGDFVWVPAGLVHAVGPGVVLAEIQQTSDLTYRVYDWNRPGLAGKPRELHVRQALDSIRFDGQEPPPGGRGRTAGETGLLIEHLVDGPAFSLSRIRLDARPWSADTEGTYVVLVALAGGADLVTAGGRTRLRAGDTVLVPAAAGEYAFEHAKELTLLAAAPPGKAPTR